MLHKVCKRGDVPKLREILTENVDVNCKDYNGWTPLHEASLHNRPDCVRMLMRRKEVDILATAGDEALTPVQEAVQAGHVQVVREIIEAGGLCKHND